MFRLISAGICRLRGEIVDVIDIFLIICEIAVRFRDMGPDPKVQDLLRSSHQSFTLETSEDYPSNQRS